jgi:long-chain fatty acid transport protein
VNGAYDANRVKNFELPELGYSLQYRPNLALGVAIYGNGGLDTSYTQPIGLFGTTRGGVDIEQVFISPTLAYKAGAHNSFGIAANIAIQRFSAEGLQNFVSLSSDPAHLTNTGHSYAAGGGVRVGWLGELNKAVSVGATYQSRTYLSKFNRYSGLFAEHGGLRRSSQLCRRRGSEAWLESDAALRRRAHPLWPGEVDCQHLGEHLAAWV